MGNARVLPLDSLRGLAALGVTLFWHYSHFGPYRPFDGPAADWLYRYGLMLVDLFFVLSGFVLSHAYLEKLANRRVSPWQFFVLRFSRLYPLHLVTLLLVAAVQAYRRSIGLEDFVYGASDLFHFVLNLAFLQQGIVRTVYSFNGPAWSLTVEEVSYLLFFVSVFFFAGKRRIAFAALVMAGVVINITAVDMHVLNLDVSRGLTGFFGGCLGYQLHRAAVLRQQSRALALIAGLVLMALVGFFMTVGYPRTAAVLLVHSLGIFPALILLVLNAPFLSWVFSLRPLAYLGEISYSVYMLHFPVQLLMTTSDEIYGLKLARSSIEFFFAYAAITIVFSAVSFHFFERPVQALIRGRIGRPAPGGS